VDGAVCTIIGDEVPIKFGAVVCLHSGVLEFRTEFVCCCAMSCISKSERRGLGRWKRMSKISSFIRLLKLRPNLLLSTDNRV
jgi:hypothetical protein